MSSAGPGDQGFRPTLYPTSSRPIPAEVRGVSQWGVVPVPVPTPTGLPRGSHPAAAGLSLPSPHLLSAQVSQYTSHSSLVNFLELRDGGLFQDHTASWK